MIITYQAKLLSKTKLAPEVDLFKFSRPPDNNWTFKAGQYMIFHVPSKDEHPVRRLYSIASPPHQQETVDFVIEYVPNGLGSTYLSGLKVGEEATLQGPAGVFTMKETDRDKIFLATGTGVAPMKSMIESILLLPQTSQETHQEGFLLQRLQHLSKQKRLYLFWGMKTCEDMYFLDEFKSLAEKYDHFKFKYCFSRETDLFTKMKDDVKHTISGRVTVGLEELLTNYDLKVTDFDYYLCGAHPVVEALRQYLSDKKVPKEQVIFEKFTTAA